jgi:hypothetical protein
MTTHFPSTGKGRLVRAVPMEEIDVVFIAQKISIETVFHGGGINE